MPKAMSWYLSRYGLGQWPGWQLRLKPSCEKEVADSYSVYRFSKPQTSQLRPLPSQVLGAEWRFTGQSWLGPCWKSTPAPTSFFLILPSYLWAGVWTTVLISLPPSPGPGLRTGACQPSTAPWVQLHLRNPRSCCRECFLKTTISSSSAKPLHASMTSSKSSEKNAVCLKAPVSQGVRE